MFNTATSKLLSINFYDAVAVIFPEIRVNFMAADALAHCFARSSAAIILKFWNYMIEIIIQIKICAE